MKASEGLHRLRDVEIDVKAKVIQPQVYQKTEPLVSPKEEKIKEKPKEEKKIDFEAKLKELEAQKEKANDLFRKSKIFSDF